MDERPCVNPLFVKWLSEWKENAASTGLKSAHTYNKAIKSLKKYPLPLASGKDCKILENFGDKICQQLDERLALYSANADVESPVSDNLPSPESRRPRHTQGQRRHGRELAEGNRPYVPQYRSGAYALLLTLYNNKQSGDNQGFMTKQELMRDAQCLANKSFRRPDPGSHYTAWSSMGTLVVKGYVIRASCPAKYIITVSGCELAVRLQQANHVVSPTCAESDCRLVQPQATRTAQVDDVRIIEDVPLMQRLGRKRQTSQNTTAEIVDGCSTSDGRATANGLLVERVGGNSTIGGTAKPYKKSTSESGRRKPTNTATTGKKLAMSSRGGKSTDRTASAADDGGLDEVMRKRPCLETAVSTAKASLTLDEMKWIVDATSANSGSQTEDKTGGATYSQEEALWEMAAYSYDVILCVDNCELCGRDREGRDILLRELEKNNVSFVVRKLQVGDFLWVAKGNTGTYRGRELMLDYIVERKRMDDLAGSIIDGRFHEQKFRLWNSGVKNVIYLIEKYGSNQHLSIAEDTLNQAIINTQVIDGFHVKHTGSTRESAAYLTLMTRQLQSVYGGKSLVCGVTNKHGQFITFQDFNDSTVKTKAMTVTEMFAKQLLQLHGMTGEKAFALTQTYATPARLLELYSSGQTQKQKEDLVAATGCGPLHRPLGTSLSKLLYMLYATQTALK